MKRAYKRSKTFRNCEGCSRRIRKDKKGKYCSERCERRYYIRSVRKNYSSRQWHRNKLLERSNICGICLNPILKVRDVTIDHIIPLNKGGKDEIANMQLAHASCNHQKGDSYPPGMIFEPMAVINEQQG